MPICKRCSKCCYYLKNGTKLYKCKHLVLIHGTERSLCRIYNKRLGTVIDTYIDNKGIKHLVKCINRIDDKTNYPGCNFNQEGYEMNIKYKE